MLNLWRSPFQHTTARRRLRYKVLFQGQTFRVSTHNRPKAAANTEYTHIPLRATFQHTTARRRLRVTRALHVYDGVFQHTTARRRLRLTTAMP